MEENNSIRIDYRLNPQRSEQNSAAPNKKTRRTLEEVSGHATTKPFLDSRDEQAAMNHQALLIRDVLFPASFIFGPDSTLPFLLRDTLTASAASPPVETAPATIIPKVAKQTGHISSLPGS
jgi:hypothetical protein